MLIRETKNIFLDDVRIYIISIQYARISEPYIVFGPNKSNRPSPHLLTLEQLLFSQLRDVWNLWRRFFQQLHFRYKILSTGFNKDSNLRLSAMSKAKLELIRFSLFCYKLGCKTAQILLYEVQVLWGSVPEYNVSLFSRAQETSEMLRPCSYFIYILRIPGSLMYKMFTLRL